jgi:hypothetical protein
MMVIMGMAMIMMVLWFSNFAWQKDTDTVF